MSNDDINEDSAISVKTPWGSLVKSNAIQSQITALRVDLNAINKRISDLEKSKTGNNSPLPSIPSPLNDAALKTFSHKVESLTVEIKTLEQRLIGLEKDQVDNNNHASDSITRVLSSFETRIVQVENKMRELDSKFDKFSNKTLQILEQLRKGSF